MIYLSVVPPPLIGPLWPKAATYLTDAVRESGEGYNLGDLRKFVDSGDMTLWVLIDNRTGLVSGAGIAELCQYPQKRVANLLMFSADEGLRDVWLPKIVQFEEWAEELGCDQVRIPRGRLGWKALLVDYRLHHIVLVKDLENKRVLQ